MLELRDIETAYGRSQVLFGVNLEVKPGEVVSLLGRNGMGKTTTVKSIMGICVPRAGAIAFDGRALQGLPPYRIAQAGLGLVPEGRQVFPNLTVRENLVATARSGKRHGSGNPWTLERVFALFPRLAERRAQVSGSLSGGEQQMLAFGRALMAEPRLLFVDELSLGLMPKAAGIFIEVLQKLRGEGVTTVLVEQNTKRALRVADRVCVLASGRSVFLGSAQEARSDSELLQRYLGATPG